MILTSNIHNLFHETTLDFLIHFRLVGIISTQLPHVPGSEVYASFDSPELDASLLVDDGFGFLRTELDK